MIAWIVFGTGRSGDMFLGALLDAGWEERRLRDVVDALDLGPVRVKVERRAHGGLTGLGLRVETGSELPHRGYRDITERIARAPLPPPVRERALAVFELLGTVEAGIHGIPLDRVHFHEIGAVDSLVDIVGTVLAVHDMGIDSILAGPVPIGGGEITMDHGVVPAPAPATSVLLEGWPIRPVPELGEFVTPTGAALLRVLARPASGMPAMRVARVGFGAGTRSHPRWPNLVRLWIGEPVEDDVPTTREGVPGPRSEADLRMMSSDPAGDAPDCGYEPILRRVAVLETQIDDMDPRFLASVCDSLLGAGALDVTRSPVLMKKGRLGTLLRVIAAVPEARRLAGDILRGTTSLGVRMREEWRWELDREVETLATSLGDVRIKWAGSGATRRPTVEFDDLERVSRAQGMPLRDLEIWILRHIDQKLNDREQIDP